LHPQRLDQRTGDALAALGLADEPVAAPGERRLIAKSCRQRRNREVR
jgi:hypothetical protein